MYTVEKNMSHWYLAKAIFSALLQYILPCSHGVIKLEYRATTHFLDDIQTVKYPSLGKDGTNRKNGGNCFTDA